MFNLKKFFDDIVSKKEKAIRPYFANDAIICWHDSNEQFTLDEFIKANCAFPSTWVCNIERVEKLEKGLAVTAQHDNIQDGISVKYVGFIQFNNSGKVQRLDEWYVAIEEIPQWRKDMKLGRPIKY